MAIVRALHVVVLAGASVFAGCAPTDGTSSSSGLADQPFVSADEGNPGASVGAVTRERRVVTILQDLANRHAFPNFGVVVHETEPNACLPGLRDHRLGPFVECGNTAAFPFDLEEANALEAQLFEAYGFDVERGERIDEDGLHVVFGGLDREHRLGFKLLGRFGPRIGLYSANVQPEPERDGLDTGEFAALRRRGWRVHTSTIHASISTAPGDLGPYLALAQGAIEFLNAVTEGEDVDARGLAFEARTIFPLPTFAQLRSTGKPEPFVGDDPDRVEPFDVKELARLHVVLPWPGVEREKVALEALASREFERDAAPTSSAGSIHCMRLPFQVSDFLAGGVANASHLRTRVVQMRSAPMEPIVLEVRGSTVILPSDFDVLRTFELEFELEPGTYRYVQSVEVAHAAAAGHGERR